MSTTLVNTIDYSPLDLALFVTGCLMWVAVYLIYVRNILRHEFIEMPVIAACSNIAWEFAWSFIFATDMGLLFQWIYKVWFFVDVIIVWGVWRYGAKQYVQEEFAKHHVPAMVATFSFFFVFYHSMTKQGMDTSIGAHSAYVCQAVISFLYVHLIWTRKSLDGFSLPVQWLRTYGTGLNTVMMLIHYRGDTFLHVLGVFSLVLDNYCIYLFYRKRRELAQTVHQASATVGARLVGSAA